MAHLQYLPGDPRLVDQLVCELKSKGIFDQFRKDCIADVDTRPAYQNLRQRVENSVSSFLARQTWQPDLNKNQLREKLRKHILDGNYLEQGVERIVDQVVNPKVATVFVPKVEDLVYNYLGITRKKADTENANGTIDLLPNDLEAVSPGSVKSNNDNNDAMEVDEPSASKEIDINKQNNKDNETEQLEITEKPEEIGISGVNDLTINDSNESDDKDSIPLPAEEIRPEDIPPPENSPPKIEKIELEKIELPEEPDVATDIPLPDEIPKQENNSFFKTTNSDDESSSDSSLRRNMSPLTPIRNFNNENSYDAQQAFENPSSEIKKDEVNEPNSFRFAIETKSTEILDTDKTDKKESDLSYKFNQVNINNFNTPAYEDSSNSNNLQIDYESDANSKVNNEPKVEPTNQNSVNLKKETKAEENKSSHKSSHSHRSRESHKHSRTSKDKKSDSKPSSSKDSSKHDKKSSKEDNKHKSSDKDRSHDRSDKRESKESSRHKHSHKSSSKDSKSHRSSSSTHRHSSKPDERKSSSSQKEKSSDKSSSKEKSASHHSKSTSHNSDKDKKYSGSSNSKKTSEKDKKSKKDTDDHYSLSGRGNPNRRSTDRDSNDGSSSSKGSHRPSSSKSSSSKKDSKSTTSKSDNNYSGSGSTTPSDKDSVHDVGNKAELFQIKPIVRIESHLETPISSPPRLPFVPDITLKKPKIAANFEEARKHMKMRKFLDEEQRRMNQEAALLLEFQANVRPCLSQVYSSIPGPELEFACNTNTTTRYIIQNNVAGNSQDSFVEEKTYTNDELYEELNAGNEPVENIKVVNQNESKYVDSNAQENPNVKSDVSAKVKDQSNNITCEKESEEELENILEESSLKNKKDSSETDLDKFETNIIEKPNITYNNEKILPKHVKSKDSTKHDNNLYFFAEHEKYNAELDKTKFNNFLKLYVDKTPTHKTLYLINCDTYEENVIREVSKNYGDYEVVNYHRNGHMKLPTNKSIVKNVNLSTEVSLPIDIDSDPLNDADNIKSQVFSPDKSDCSFELSSDYDTRLEEMVTKTSRKEIMQIILGDMVEVSPTKMPKIDYITESNLESPINYNLKRKIDEDTTENNNRPVLTPHKTRKMSTSDVISSTTQDVEETPSNKVSATRSKYLGRAKRVGLPRPKRAELPNSPSSDKSVENYEQNTLTPKTPNGKVKTPRHLVQRYETSDLYKPKLHYLSRRNVS